MEEPEYVKQTTLQICGLALDTEQNLVANANPFL